MGAAIGLEQIKRLALRIETRDGVTPKKAMQKAEKWAAKQNAPTLATSQRHKLACKCQDCEIDRLERRRTSSGNAAYKGGFFF